MRNRRHPANRPLRLLLVVALFATSISFLFATDAPDAQAGPPPVIYAYVPLPTDDYQTALYTVNSAAGTTMNERIGITVAAAGSVVYYDHWEDGFEADVANPSQASTQIWGDGDASNGNADTYCASGCSGDVFSDGAVLFFEESIPTPRTTAQFFDGGDKVAGTRGFTVTKAGWGSAGPLHAGSVSAFDTSRFGTFFEAPVGEDTVGGPIGNNPFNYTGVSVMASRPNTFVQVDLDADGTYDQSATLGEGETLFVNGGISQGARIAANQPVQAHLLTGDRTATYEDRWFELFPVAVWDNSYFASAVTAAGAGPTDQTELWIHNNKASDIDVDVRGPSGILTTLTVPAGGTSRYTPPASTAVELTSSDGTFYALGAIGTGSPSGSSTHDWGYTLVPTSILTPSVVVGWAPGNSTSPPTANYSAVWVASTSATTIHVDYDDDGTADTSFASPAYTSTPIFDPSDYNMTGARIYTTDGTTITAAYGQDPAVAPAGGTALDLGITVVPSTALVVAKDVSLTNDVAGDGLVNPGDTIRWDITVSDAGALSLTNVVVRDTVPLNTTYVPGSAVADFGSGTVAIPDDTVPPASTPFPFDEGGYTLGTIDPGVTFSVRFETVVDDPVPAGTERITNVVGVGSSQTSATAAADAPVFVPSLTIDKMSSTGGAPLSPGDTYSYDIVVENTGNTFNTNVVVTDQLPDGVTWVSTAVQAPVTVSTTTWTDDFESVTWTGGSGPWAAGWGEVNDNTSATSGDVLISADGGSQRLHIDDASRGAFRSLGDLSSYDYVELSFDYRRQSFDSEFEWVQVDVSPDDGNASSGTWNPVLRFDGPADDPGYLSATAPITSLVNSLPGEASVVRFATSPSMDDTDDAWIDDVQVVGLVRATAFAPGVEPTSANGYQLTAAPLGLGPGDTATITVTVQVDDPMAPFSDTLVNTALVTSDQQPTPAGSQVTDTVELVDLELDKAVTTPAGIAGQDATFTITVTNQGPTDATGVAVTDQLPAELAYVSDTPSQGTYDDTTGVWTVGALPVGDSATLDIVATVLSNDEFSNSAEVTATDQTDSDSTPGNDIPSEDDQDSVTIDIVEGADLEVTKEVTTPAPYVGQDVTFTITVVNRGLFPTTGVAVTDLLPVGLVYVSDVPSQGSYVPTTGVWTVGDLAVGQAETLQLIAEVGVDTLVVNSAQVTASGLPDPDSTPNNSVPSEDDQDSASVDAEFLIDLSLGKTVDDATPRIGDIVRFSIEVANGGPSNASGVEVTDLLPSGLAYDSHTTTQGSYASATGVWTVGDVDAGATATLTVDAIATGDGAFTNVAEVTAANEPDVDSTPGNGDVTEDDRDVATVTVAPEADLSLTKVETAVPSYIGDDAQFLITVLNSGPDTATGVEISDVLPAGLTLVSATPSLGAYDDTTGIWTVGAVGVGTTETLTITATVETVDPVINTAEVTASDQYDPDSIPGNGLGTEDDQNAAIVNVDPLADLSLSKIVDDPSPRLGEVVTFTITLMNDGPSDATDVAVTDQLPSGLLHVGDSASVGTYDDVTGVWAIGTVAAGASVTLDIEAMVVGGDAGTNTAEVTAATEDDPDSTPDNGDDTEDDLASAVWDPTAIDLALTKTVSDESPDRGSQVTFTVELTNDGPDGASGVVVTDLLPAGLTHIGHSTGNGTYDEATGIWDVGDLAAGSSAALTVTVDVDTDAVTTNTAEVTAANQPDIDSTPGNGVVTEDDIAQAMISPVPVVDLSVTKSETAAPSYLGDTATFVVTVANAGPSDATGVQVTDLLPAGITYVAHSTSQGVYDDSTGIWTIGAVDSGEVQQLTVTAIVDTIASTTNTAELTAANERDVDSAPGNGVPTEDDQDSALVDVDPAIDLSVAKSVDDSRPDVGENVTFTISVDNAGPSQATGVELTDLLPAGLTYVSHTASQGTYAHATGVWGIGDIANGGSANLQVTATVATAEPITNVAEITAANEYDRDSQPGNGAADEDDHDSASIAGTLIDLSLTKGVSASTVGVGADVTWTVTVANDGPSTATGVEVTDVLPAGAFYLSDSPGQGTFDPGTGVWTVGSLPPDGTATLEITTTIIAAGDVSNTAEVTAADQPDADSTPSNGIGSEDDQDTATVSGLLIDLELDKTVDDATALVGTDVTFTLTIANAGVSTATGVSVTDVLPAGFTYVGDTPSQGTYDSDTGLWTIGSLLVSQSETLMITATVNSTGVLTNIAEVASADQPDSDSTPANGVDTEDDLDSATVTPTPNADLELTKTVDDSTPLRGSRVTFTLRVDNRGPNDATGVEVVDVLPAGLEFTGYAASQGTYDSGSGLWAVGDIASGGAATIEVEATVDSDAPMVNTAEVTAADQVDPDSTPDNGIVDEDDHDTVGLTPVPVADLRLAKSVDTAAPQIGDTVVFTITVANDGPSDATGVTVDDLLPAGVTHLGHTTTEGTYDETTGVWDVGALAVGDSQTLEVSVSVDVDTAIVNEAEIATANEADPDSTPGNGEPLEDDLDTATISATALIDLDVAKTVDEPAPNVGSDVTFTVTVTNSGPSDATGVVLTDALPAGLIHVSDIASQGVYDDATGVWTVGGIDAGSSVTLLVTARMSRAGDVVNTAEVTAADQPDSDSTPNNNEPTEDDQAASTVTGQLIDLEVTQTVDQSQVGPGDVVTFTVTIDNRGPSTATGVTLTELLPPGLTYVSDTAGGSFEPATGVWTVGSLNADGSASFDLTVTVGSLGAHTAVAQVATADQPDLDSAPGNDASAEDDQSPATVTATLVDLSVTKVASDDVIDLGSPTTFTITVTNDGPDAATGVVLTDDLPAGLLYVSAVPSQGVFDVPSSAWIVGDLAVGQTEQLELTATGTASGTHTNVVEITAADQSDADSVPGNDDPDEDDRAEASVRVVVVDLSLTKAVDDSTPAIGDDVVFTITVANGGPDDATAVSASDLLPAGLSFVSATASVGSYDAGSGVWDIGGLATGTDATLSVIAKVTTPDAVENMAQVASSDQVDVDSIPGNGVAAEDDQDSAIVDAEAASLSGLVWIDVDEDGLFDPDEPLADGVEVTLYDDAGGVAGSVATGPDGAFEFVDLPPGEYTVELTSLPDDVELGTYDPDGTIDGRYTVALADGDNALDVDFGLVQAATVSTTTTSTTVPASSTTTTTAAGGLPATGADLDVFGLIGFALLVIGLALTTAVAYRRQED